MSRRLVTQTEIEDLRQKRNVDGVVVIAFDMGEFQVVSKGIDAPWTRALATIADRIREYLDDGNVEVSSVLLSRQY